MRPSPAPNDNTELLPFGQLATRQWLLAQGMTRHALDNALKSGKVVALARGVVARSGVPVTWQGLAASLNRMLQNPVYVGGLSALEQAGFGHYLRAVARMHMYSAEPHPAWMEKVDVGTEIVWHNNRRLWEASTLAQAGDLKEMSGSGSWLWLMATPEQAWLEVLAEVPDAVSFEHADELMQGLTSLSPRRLDALLKGCRHIKVKRLFFFFAARYHYGWFKHLDCSAYDLGSGKRVVAKGGRLDKDWLITVPDAFHEQE